MSVSGVETALRTWVKTATGFGHENVFFADQKVERPAGPYATIRLDGPLALGSADEETVTYDPDADPGEEIEIAAGGVREFLASIQVFNAPTTGDSTAVDVLSKVQLALGLPSVRDALNAAGVSVFDRGSVRNLSALLGTAFDGRGSLDVRCYARLTVSEFTTFIERVQGTAFDIPYELEP